MSNTQGRCMHIIDWFNFSKYFEFYLVFQEFKNSIQFLKILFLKTPKISEMTFNLIKTILKQF